MDVILNVELAGRQGTEVAMHTTNQNTIFEYKVWMSQLISIEIFDLTGKIVDQIFNGILNSGSHSINYNITALYSGIYIYKIIR